MESLTAEKFDQLSLIDKLAELQPVPEKIFVPEEISSEKEKKRFLSGEIRNPHFIYDRLTQEDCSLRDDRLLEVSQVINDNMDEANRLAYENVVEYYRKINRYIQLCQKIHEPGLTDDNKFEISRELMQINIEVYGKPDEEIFRSLLADEVSSVIVGEQPDQAEKIRQELTEMTSDLISQAVHTERFAPSSETIALAQRTAVALYGGMLRHVPDREEAFNPEEVRDIFEEIIESEFGSFAHGWRVVVEPATSINVVAAEKLIKIPEDRKPIKPKNLQGLVVHELGVHMLRSLMGETNNVAPLRLGLGDYLDNEDGLAVALQQAIQGKYKESGTNYYLIEGLAYHDNKDFRDCFEIMWKIKALSKLSKKTDVSTEEFEEIVDNSKKFMYRQVFRIFRGTDELPWFKDLVYYNGSKEAWRYLETQGADFTTLSLLLTGKADPSNPEHRRIILNSKTAERVSEGA